MSTKDVPADTMTYAQAYSTMEEVVEQMRTLGGKDLDQVLPLLRKFHAARTVVLARIEAIERDPILQEALKADQSSAPSPTEGPEVLTGTPEKSFEDDDIPF